MRFRAVRIQVETDDSTAEFMTAFDEGLVVVTGHNSMGKSLLFQSLVYGLGLEGMYGPERHHGLLTRAVTEEITLNGADQTVRKSWVMVEIQNSRGDIVTTQRSIVGGDNDQLVATWSGPAITDPDTAGEREDYFVRRGGAAVAGAGFHRLLADFIGWTLPEVPTFNQTEVPLYLEVLFPLVITEQKSGWAGVLPRLPTYLQIRDPLQRDIEFYLGLELLERTRLLQRLADRETELHREFDVVGRALDTTASLRGARLVGLEDWASLRRRVASDAETTTDVWAETLEGSQWVPIDSVLERPKHDVEITSSTQASPERTDVSELSARLAQGNERLSEISAQLTAAEQTIDMIHTQLGSLQTRIGAVDEERRRYEELRTLVNLGSPVAVATFSHRDCPTCRQSLDGLEHQPHLATLDYEQSLALLTEQAKTLRALQADAERSVGDQVVIRTAFERQADEVRRELRAIKADLVAPENFPSIAEIQERLEVQNRRSDLQNLQIELLEHTAVMDRIAAETRNLLLSRRELGSADLTADEQSRLSRWNGTFQLYLRALGVTTIPIDDIQLTVGGRPQVEGYDVGFQASASDVIRLRWAYSVSLMVTSQGVGGRHPSVLMMDEPRQQEVEDFDKFGLGGSTERSDHIDNQLVPSVHP